MQEDLMILQYFRFKLPPLRSIVVEQRIESLDHCIGCILIFNTSRRGKVIDIGILSLCQRGKKLVGKINQGVGKRVIVGCTYFRLMPVN